jgi:WD40 repeat-containing protein SMU1
LPSFYNIMEEVIKGEDVIRLILQFCKENDMLKTYNSMKEETELKDNFVKDLAGFQKAFRDGAWDVVLLELNDMTLSRGLLMDIFELIIFELCQSEEYDLCRYIIKDVMVQKSKLEVITANRTPRGLSGPVQHNT